MKPRIILIALMSIMISISCSSSKQENTEKEEATVANIEIKLHVEGMTCDHCEMSIQKGVNELDGIAKVEANHEDSTTFVIFDPSKTDKEKIAAAIEERGYHVVE